MATEQPRSTETPERDAEASEKPRCYEETGAWICTRLKGHAGAHNASGLHSWSVPLSPVALADAMGEEVWTCDKDDAHYNCCELLVDLLRATGYDDAADIFERTR